MVGDGTVLIMLGNASKNVKDVAKPSNSVMGLFFKDAIFQILGFVNLWVGNATLKLINQQIEMPYQIAVDWSSFCREVLLDAFI